MAVKIVKDTIDLHNKVALRIFKVLLSVEKRGVITIIFELYTYYNTNHIIPNNCLQSYEKDLVFFKLDLMTGPGQYGGSCHPLGIGL